MRKLLYILISAAVLLLSVPLIHAETDTDTDDSRSKALRSLKEAADSGNTAALFYLARLYETGNDPLIKADPSQALRLYTQAADSAYPPALNYLGYIRFHGMLGTEIDPDTALRLIEKAAMLGDPSAAANLGWLLSQKDTPVKTDPDKAIYWLKKASQSGSYLPFQAIADIYRSQGLYTLEEQYADSAALRGSTDAVDRLLELRKERYSALPTDSLMKEALGYYHSGSPLLGLRLMDMLDERPDASEADKALSTAIRGQLHSQGLILPYDYTLSLQLFLSAAEMGDPSAQYIVAETIDITPDAFSPYTTLTADEWRQAAARKGVNDSHTALSRLLP